MITYERSFSGAEPEASEKVLNAIGMLVQQLETVNLRLHHVSKDVARALATAKAATRANPVGFLLWHMARSQDWAVQTAMRGVPEVVRRRP